MKLKALVGRKLMYGFLATLVGLGLSYGQAVAAEGGPSIKWQQEIEDTQTLLTDVILTSDNQLSVGSVSGLNSYNEGVEAYLSRWDEDGNLQWSDNVQFENSVYNKTALVFDVVPAQDGGFLVSGEMPDFHWKYDQAFVAKVDSNGETLWQQSLSGGGGIKVTSLVESADGSVIYSTSPGYINVNTIQSKVGKISATGQTEWVFSTVPANKLISEFSVINADVTATGEVIVAGNIDNEFRLWKLNQSGNQLWSTTLQTQGTVKAVSDGYLVLSSPSAGSNTSQLNKIDESGNQVWTAAIDSGKIHSVNENQEGYLLAAEQGIYQTDFSGNVLWSGNIGSVTKALQINDNNIIALADNKVVKLSPGNASDPVEQEDPTLPAGVIKFDSEEYSISQGDTFDTVINWYDQEGNPVNVSQYCTFSSNQPDVLTIDSLGNITGVSRGTSVISAVYGDQTTEALVYVY